MRDCPTMRTTKLWCPNNEELSNNEDKLFPTMRDYSEEIICHCPNEHLNAQIKSQHFQQTSEMFHTGLKDILFLRVDFIFLQHMDLSYSNAILDMFLDSGILMQNTIYIILQIKIDLFFEFLILIFVQIAFLFYLVNKILSILV